MLRLGLILILALSPVAVFAQGKAQTLADIRAELDALMADFTGLKAELVQSAGAGTSVGGGDALRRMDAIEAELTRLTAKIEEVELKLNRVVSDGTKRIGDIEFRLCEVTEGCDVSTLPETPVLGGGAAVRVESVAPVINGASAPELALNEKVDFDKANALYTSADFRQAADKFAAFVQNYPGGPLTQEAAFLRGEALAQLGDTAGSARSYLEAFSGQPSGPRAGQALLKLGQALGALAQTPEACVTLKEVETRFPGSAEAGNAKTAMQGLGCS
jgi:tol-pal system protein YbgF